MSTYYLLGIVYILERETKSLHSFFSFPSASTKEMPWRAAVSLRVNVWCKATVNSG